METVVNTVFNSFPKKGFRFIISSPEERLGMKSLKIAYHYVVEVTQTGVMKE
jgi:hypothetical protein